MRRALATAMLAALCAARPAGAADPQRIVSLNLCADELVLALAPKDKVRSVTWLARDPRGSNVASLAQDLPVNRGLADEIVALKPDLVLAGAFTTRTTVGLLHRFAIPVLELGVPETLEAAYDQIAQVAERIGAAPAGAAMVARMKQGFAALPPVSPRRPGALVLRPNGFTAGRGSLVDEVLSRAGLDNLAARLAPDRLGQLTLEDIVRARPDLLIIDGADGAASLANDLLFHPALRAYAESGRLVPVPTRLWACAGPGLVEAAQRLAAARMSWDAGAGR